MATTKSASLPKGRKKVTERPFYEKPADRETSADIISQARTSLRTLKTARPFTPKEDKRTLFSGSTSRAAHERPPSAFSLGAHHFDGSDSRPPSAATRLLPLDKRPQILGPPSSPTSKGTPPVLPRPPVCDPKRPISGKRKARAKLMHAISQEGDVQVLPQPLERRSSNPFPKSKSSSAISDVLQRRAHSGPKERTMASEEGDGVEENQDSALRVRSAESVLSNSRESSRTESGYSTDRGSSGSRSGSAGRKEEEDPKDALYWNSRVTPILEQLDALSTGQPTISIIDSICVKCTELYQVLEGGGLFSKGGKRRSVALKSLFRLLDVKSSGLHMRAARIVLAFSNNAEKEESSALYNVTGHNLASLCKLVFKISREEKNDELFLEDNILDLIISLLSKLDPVTSCESLVYTVGALKFLSSNTRLMPELARKNLLMAFSTVLHSININSQESRRPSKSTSNLLLQIIPTLRNLADSSENRPSFIKHEIIPELCTIMEVFASDGDLMMNISRLLSKLTLHNDCCAVLGDQRTSFTSLINILNKHPDRPDLVVRICFVLGNLTSKNDDCRYCLFNTDNAMETLLVTFRKYLAQTIKKANLSKASAEQNNNNGSDSSSPGSATPTSKEEDVLNKLVRVIANLSINQDIGALITSNETCVDLLLQVLECKSLSESEELVINTVITINNLSFYDTVGSAIVERQLSISRLLLRLMMTDNMDGVVEAARVYGNLSRTESIRDFLTSKKVDEMMVTLLDSGDREVVYVACGVLINLMTDEKRRPTLKKEAGIRKLIDVLRDFSRTDWQLAGMVCMILWNYSEKMSSSPETFGEQEVNDLTELLADFLDEDVAMETPDDASWDEDTILLMRSNWKAEFCPVASQLLDRIERCHGDLIPIDDK